MSFLLDPPLLFLNGAAYARLAPEPLQRRMSRPLSAATLGVFYAVSGALWREDPRTRPLWRAFRSQGGRDFMVNSGVLRLDARRVPTVAALALFATYPLFLLAGYRWGRAGA